ncbi:MAG: tRNA (guanosine(46)-N7)-methyltransferase TrmB [Isosphaeraceae bacterium]|nr:tRNA (guanosine(46)-N7)-methyltransferase TrmB [Isosphaeraceae bacterium]
MNSAPETSPDPSETMTERRPPLDTTPFTLNLDPARLDAPLSWPDIFGDGRPVELEVGSGKGLFLANAGQARPEHNFLGIEISRKYANKAAERIAKLKLANVKMYSGDARLFLARAVPSASLRAVHVYFPDPWWKARHKKRRVFCEPLVADVERCLEPGGELWVATDVEEYYGVIRELVADHPRFEEQSFPAVTAPEHDHDYLTNFERKYRIEGRPIYRALYRLQRGPA